MMCMLWLKISNGAKLSSFIEQNANSKPVYNNYLLIYGLEDYSKFEANFHKNNTLIDQGYNPREQNEKFKKKMPVLILEYFNF